MIADLVTYDRVVAGEAIGSCCFEVTGRDIADYRAIAGTSDLELPLSPGLAVALMMRAYMRLMPKRPPGTIHASQKLTLGAPISPGDRITVALRCVEKERRKERGWVRFESEMRNQRDQLVLLGDQWMVWAT